VKSVAHALLLAIAIALAINFLQGGPQRVTRWTVRRLTGRDLIGPAPARNTSVPARASHPKRA
jgi:HAMP domain-containing protein